MINQPAVSTDSIDDTTVDTSIAVERISMRCNVKAGKVVEED